jgi:hypothetical protein
MTDENDTTTVQGIVRQDIEMLDVTGDYKRRGVEVNISEDARVLWVNVAGVCRLRVCRIEGPITIKAPRSIKITR